MLHTLLVRAPFDVGDSYRGVLEQDFFDLPREHALATPYQHITLAVDDSDKTVFIDAGNVAGGQPTLMQAFLTYFFCNQIKGGGAVAGAIGMALVVAGKQLRPELYLL